MKFRQWGQETSLNISHNSKKMDHKPFYVISSAMEMHRIMDESEINFPDQSRRLPEFLINTII